MEARPATGAGRRALLALLFLVSGATALVYEVSWTRRLVLLVGSTSAATALLLAAWMLGLALGARLGGPVADRSRRPLRLYAILEAGAAGLALLLPFLLDGLGSLGFLVAAGREPLLLGAAFAVLLAPTALLGATLPALARAAVDAPGDAGSRVGFLYAANTLGAVVGCLGAGFVLVEAFGVDGAGRVGVVANLLVAAAAWALSRGEDAAPAAAGAAPGAEAPAPDPAPDPGTVRAATVAACVAGFVGLASEVAWTRVLVFSLQGFTAAFAAMLGAFLLGSGLGSAFFAGPAGRARRPLEALGWIQVGVAVLACGTLAALHHQHDLVGWLRGAVAPFGSHRANHHAVLLASALLVIGPPAFLMGGVFAAAVRAVAGGTGDLGARVGSLYAANTVGAVAGALGAGFVGVPLLGARGTAAAAAAISLAAGAATLLRAREPGARRPLLLAGAALLAGLLVHHARIAEPMILRSAVFLGARGRENRLVESREGRAGAVSVVENVRNGFTSLYTDEFLAASTEGRYRYMRMLGHVPMVLAEDPRSALVMAFGTGTTAGSLSTHPGLERLDVVEISPEVYDVAGRFASVNRDVVARAGGPGKPAIRLFVEDARRFVLARPETWDVITLEPLMPYTPGAVHLYTREFYELCRARLTPGGAVCQWFPIHGFSVEDFRSLAAAFVEVFPESSLWFIEETAALVGTVRPQGVPVARAAERFRAPGPREDLEAGRLDDLAQWWSFRICGGAALREWTRGAAPLVDDRPDLEFRPVPAGTLTTYLHDNLVVTLGLMEEDPVAAAADLSGVPERERGPFRERLAAAAAATEAYLLGRAKEDLFGFHASHTRLLRDPRAAAAHGEAAAEALRAAVVAYGEALRANPRDRIVADRWRNVEALRLLNEGRARLRAGDAAAAAEAYAGAAETGAPWNRDEAWTGHGRALLRLGRPVAARASLAKALGIYPGNRDAQALMGEALVALGRVSEARPFFAAAWEGGSGPADEDTATLNARDRAATGAADGPAPDAAAEIRAALVEAMEAATGPEGPARERGRARLRGAAGPEAEILAELLAPAAATAADGAAAAAERVRALSLLAAAADARLADAAAAAARSGDAALAAAAVDAAAGAGAAGLARMLDPAVPPAARERALDRLASVRSAAAVEAVFRGLEDADVAVRKAAHAAIFELTGKKEFDPEGSAAERTAAVAALRLWWMAERTAWK